MNQTPHNKPPYPTGRLKEPVYMRIQEDGLLLRSQRFETVRGVYRLFFYWDKDTEDVWMLKFKGNDLVEAVSLTALGRAVSYTPDHPAP